eukprot:jgi/Bigna1/77151/fgenesh1_pg.46_\
MRVFQIVILLVLSVALTADEQPVNVRAWWSPPSQKFEWPEMEYPEIARKLSSAISFSGGGSRSFAATLGYLRGLKDIGALDKPRYITGVSGGNWAVAVYSFRQNGADDDTLLGTYTEPSDITLESIAEIADGCALNATTYDIWPPLIKAVATGWVTYDWENCGEVWLDLIWDSYLKPFGIPYDAVMMYDEQQADSFTARNSNMSGDFSFITPLNISSRPYPILGVTLVGPASLSPFPLKERGYTFLEATPLYVGEMHAQNITFRNDCVLGRKCRNQTVLIGGLIESPGFGGGALKGGNKGYIPGNSSTLNLTISKLFTLREAVALSSLAPSAFVSSFTPLSSEWLPKCVNASSVSGRRR